MKTSGLIHYLEKYPGHGACTAQIPELGQQGITSILSSHNHLIHFTALSISDQTPTFLMVLVIILLLRPLKFRHNFPRCWSWSSDLLDSCGSISLEIDARSDVRLDTGFSLLVVGKEVWPNTQSINRLWQVSQWHPSSQSTRNRAELHKM